MLVLLQSLSGVFVKSAVIAVGKRGSQVILCVNIKYV